MIYRIVGIDPGETTGLVSFVVNDDEEILCVESYELNLLCVGNYLHTRLGENSILAYEVANKFQPSGHVSSEVIGLVKYFGMRNYCSLIPVTQSAHKKLITRDVLKKAGLYVKGGHAKDAAGVGLFHVVSGLHLCKDVLRQGDE